MDEKGIILIGYSGHGYVVYGIFNSAGKKVVGYCDREEKRYNPFSLTYFGTENEEKSLSAFKKNKFFISIGDNSIRRKIYEVLSLQNLFPINAIHASAVIDKSSEIKNSGVMVSAGVYINPLAKIGNGAICNTGCIIEHECTVADFAHIGPGTVLCGNVSIGENSFVGANSVVREKIKIGKNVIVGAGSVVVKDIPDNAKAFGNPARILQ